MSSVENRVSLDPNPVGKLHPVHGIVWAAFWGTPIAAGIVMAINFWRLGNKRGAIIAAVAGALATILLFAIAFLAPEEILDRIPNAAFYIPQLMLVYGVAMMFQAAQIKEHAVRGGQVASAWPSVGIGLLCLPVLCVAIFGIALAAQPSYGTLVTIENDEVYYTGEATEADARKLGAMLRELGFFEGSGTSVQLETTNGKSTLSFVLVDNAWNEPETVEGFKEIGESLANEPLGHPLTLRLCDNTFEPKVTLNIQ